jgi:hypothetical protein
MPKKVYPNDEAPVYEIYIGEDDNTGIRLVSLVEDPAIDVKGMFFKKEELHEWKFTNIEDKQMIVGPALIPNKKIPRKDEDGELYFVYFTEDTIKLMVEKFNRENNNKSINIDHSNEMVNAYIQQNWIIEDSYYDKSKMYGYNLPKGTWFIAVKVEDKDQWNQYVKEGGRYSFSVEGLMGQKPMAYSIEDIIDSLDETEIDEIFEALKKKISFDFDGTLSRPDIQEIAKRKVADKTNDVYIVTRRYKETESAYVYQIADEVGIKRDNVFFTDGKFKYITIALLDIDIHYDDKPAEIALIKSTTMCKCVLV